MKKTLLLTLLFILPLSCGNSKKAPPQSNNATVKVCTGKYSKRFHDHHCRGLKSCKGEIITVTLGEAEKGGYTACGYCYK
jgi:predicted nucleic acid binding AN1-type Zn finger protein